MKKRPEPPQDPRSYYHRKRAEAAAFNVELLRALWLYQMETLPTLDPAETVLYG